MENVEELSFVFHAKLEAAYEYLLDEVNSSAADRVLVVGNYPVIYSNLTDDAVKRHTLLPNAEKSLTWLIEATRFSRKSKSPLAVVTNWPRNWSPLKAHYVRMPGNMVGKCDGTSGGTFFEYDDDSSASIRLLSDKDSDSTIAIYFFGIFASSYYSAVYASQDYPHRKHLACKVITCEKDPNIYSETMRVLRRTQDSNEHDKILREHCDTLETWCKESKLKMQGRIYDGDVLLPTEKSYFKKPPIGKQWWQFWK